jgi:hypothetical protein
MRENIKLFVKCYETHHFRVFFYRLTLSEFISNLFEFVRIFVWTYEYVFCYVM